jgi:Protein of unknown function (DUF732)
MKKFIFSGLAAIAVALGIFAATPAQASPTGYATPDAPSYLAALSQEGISYNSSSVQVGMQVCTLLRKGITVYDVANMVSTETDVSFRFAFKVSSAAQTYLCPDAVSSSSVSGSAQSI